MTRQKAIKLLNERVKRRNDLVEVYNQSNIYPLLIDTINEAKEELEIFKIAIDALGKQIPKKPELIPIEENTKYTWKCPTCGGYEIFKFCQHCGQKINWGKEPRGEEEE